jgi:hypothetical protein
MYNQDTKQMVNLHQLKEWPKGKKIQLASNRYVTISHDTI